MTRAHELGRAGTVFRNLLAGLTVSFVAISLGAAFGILSERGAFAGILSAGIIAAVTALLGGTRVQCSGPTAPMTAVTAILVGYSHDQLAARLPTTPPEHFVNAVLLLAGILMVSAGALRLGRFISLVPRVVVSGFMDGIAILIWVDQLQRLFGLGDRQGYSGGVVANTIVAAATFGLVLGLPRVLAGRPPKLALFLPTTLISIISVSLVVHLSGVAVERVSLAATIRSWGDIAEVVGAQWPRAWSWSLLIVGLPFALQLTLLGYLDTLLTSRVVDRITGERTAQSRELAAQGTANAAVALIGGIPGAQATIRSVLIVKEGATLRLAGVATGIFVIVEMVLFQDLIGHIPQAVFAGILIKVGHDVFDWHPLSAYLRDRVPGRQTAAPHTASAVERLKAGHIDVLFILGTAMVTVFWDLNVAVIGFALLFHAARRIIPIRDLTRDVAMQDED